MKPATADIRGRRVLVIGRAGNHRTETAIVRALRTSGCRAWLLPVNGWGRLPTSFVRRLVDALAPDSLVLTRYATDLGDDRLRALRPGRFTVAWYFDAKQASDAPILSLAPYSDHLFVTSPSTIPSFRAAGFASVAFLPQGLDPATDRPVTRAPQEFACEVSFVGSGSYPHRWPLLARFAHEMKLQIRGPGWNSAPDTLPIAGGRVLGRTFAQVVHGATVSLGMNAVPLMDQDDIAMSNRIWKVLGCGGTYLGQWLPRAPLLARHGEHCLWFRDADEAIALAKEMVNDPERRARIAAAGRAHALAHHTYAERMPWLLTGTNWKPTA